MSCLLTSLCNIQPSHFGLVMTSDIRCLLTTHINSIWHSLFAIYIQHTILYALPSLALSISRIQYRLLCSVAGYWVIVPVTRFPQSVENHYCTIYISPSSDISFACHFVLWYFLVSSSDIYSKLSLTNYLHRSTIPLYLSIYFDPKRSPT